MYSALYSRWQDKIFASIAASEQKHMDSIKGLLTKYDIPVPTGAGSEPGKFEDESLQKMYDQLTAKGEASLEAALYMGATVEDLDIADLQSHLKDVDNKDIAIVYQNLMKGSRNHLRSFYSRISGMGKTYQAQYISGAELQQIVSTPRETGPVDENGNVM